MKQSNPIFYADKPSWGNGPWQSEPDELYWQDETTALLCAILRGSSGVLCGYVGVPPGHPLFGWDRDDKIPLRQEFLEAEIDDVGILEAAIYATGGDEKNGVIPIGMALRVHGGITWSGDLPTEPGSGHHWFGFDCAHAGDYCPAIEAQIAQTNDMLSGSSRVAAFKRRDRSDRDTYRTMDFVKGECERLARQLHQLNETRLFRKRNDGASSKIP